jgi:hypothetical protein
MSGSVAACRWPAGSARWWPPELPTRGEQSGQVRVRLDGAAGTVEILR